MGYGRRVGLAARLDLFYGQNGLDGVEGHTSLAGGLGNVVHTFRTQGSASPYLIGGIGAFNVKISSNAGGLAFTASSTRLAIALGGGVRLKAGKDSRIFIEGRYVSVQTSQGATGFLPLTVGVSFGAR